MASSLGGDRMCLTLFTLSPHKPAKSSCMKKPEKQKNKQVSFKWLSCVPVAQDSWSDHFSGDLGSIPPSNQGGRTFFLLQQGPPSVSGAFVPCQKEEERRMIQPRSLSGRAQVGSQMQTWLWLWPECHNGSRAEPAPSWRDTRVGRENAVLWMCDLLHSVWN